MRQLVSHTTPPHRIRLSAAVRAGVFCIVLPFLIPAAAAAQSVEPDEPEIVLPRMLLEIQDLSVERVETVLPEELELEVPNVTLPLPEEKEMYVSDSAFDVTVDRIELAHGPVAARESSIFSDGMVGVGSMNHILGSISIYKLGTEPRFSLQFSHEGLDGFARHNPGEGFFLREDSLSGSLGLRDGTFQTDIAASFHERELGLQQVSARFSSVTHRFIDGSSLFTLSPSDVLRLSGSLEAGATNMLLTLRNSDDPGGNTFSEYTVSPVLEAVFEYPSYSFGFLGTYGFRTLADHADSSAHRGALGGSFDLEFSIPLYLEGGIGVYWNSVSDLYVPFDLGITARYHDVLSVFVKGGYAVEEQSFTWLWETVPLVDVRTGTQPLRDAAGFYVEGGFGWLLMNGMSLEGRLGFMDQSNAVSVRFDRFDPQTGLYAWESGSFLRLAASLAFSWEWRDTFSFGLRYAGEFLEHPAQVPDHSFSLNADLISPSGRFGGSIGTALDLYSASAIPELDLGGFFRLSDGLRFSLEAKDLLSVFLEHGRKYYGDGEYTAPGFHLTLKTQISL
mgnify:CR=1 FL=1|jgi:hypothetical protein